MSAPPNGPVRVKEALSTADFFCTTILIISISRSVFKTSRPDFLDITGVRQFLCDAELVAWRRFMFLANTDNLAGSDHLGPAGSVRRNETE